MRRAVVLSLVAICITMVFATVVSGVSAQSRQAAEAKFRTWLEQTVWPKARQTGVSRATFDAALAGVTLDWSLPDLSPSGAPPQVNWQAEFSSPANYMSENTIAPLVRIGRQLKGKWASTLNAVEQRYGVPREIVLAIWGRESAFGRAAIPKDAVRTIATQAFIGSRRDLYFPELIAILQILQAGEVPRSALKSSVAGALGQPQFLPSKYLQYAVDFDGDGRRDIWNSVPDTLGSIGNYLAKHGWQRGQHWGHEARVPETVNCAIEGPANAYALSEFHKAGVAHVSGTALPGRDRDPRHLMMPAGRLGPAFIVSKNFYVLKDYNESDLYALFVGHVSDRLKSDHRIAGKWNTSARFRRGDVREMQKRLEAKGYDVGGADGLVGFRTRTAIGLWQRQNGLSPTCFPDAALIRTIR